MRLTLSAVIILASTLPALALANPASVFCEEMKGRLETATLKNGDEIGLCFLPDGQIIEEWTLFRMHEGKRPEG